MSIYAKELYLLYVVTESPCPRVNQDHVSVSIDGGDVHSRLHLRQGVSLESKAG